MWYANKYQYHLLLNVEETVPRNIQKIIYRQYFSKIKEKNNDWKRKVADNAENWKKVNILTHW